nr:lytic murein transglycosylase [Paraurantiacibacter namhicola]
MASAQDMSFEAYLELVAAKARAEGVSEPTIRSMLGGLTPNARVLALDTDNVTSPSRSGYPALAPYIRRHNSAARISAGRREYGRLGPLASRVESAYGVPANVLLAIWGHETSYGAVKGSFDLAQALATLAWEGRRRTLFEGELIALLKIADRGYPRSQLVGSWAGAFGNPQFLPSVYLRLATDGDGDGRADIFSNRADTLFSIAKYFNDAGWRPGLPWGVRAYVPSGLDRSRFERETTSPVCPRVHERHGKWMTVAEWRAEGVTPQSYLPDNAMVALFEPDGPGTSAYLLTQNYRVILEYNCSNYYAMSVGLLADEIIR